MSYIDGEMIRKLRERKGLTQAQLAEMIMISDKAVSKWETGKGYPNISVLPDLAKALDVSVGELFMDHLTVNRNVGANVARGKFYVCPICGNVIWSIGDAVVACCGSVLIPEDPEKADESHFLTVEKCDDEYYVTSDHPMEKDHYISFIAMIYYDSVSIVRLYPESEISVHFRRSGAKELRSFCTRHGSFVQNITKTV